MSSSGSHLNPSHSSSYVSNGFALASNGTLGAPSRSRTPNHLSDHPSSSQLGNAPDPEPSAEDDPRTALFNKLYAQSEVKLDALFARQQTRLGEQNSLFGRRDTAVEEQDARGAEKQTIEEAEADKQPSPEQTKAAGKKAARAIDEDNYDDSDDSDEPDANVSPLKNKSTGPTTIPIISSPSKPLGIPPSPALTTIQGPTPQWQGKTSDDVRKKLEEDKEAAAENAVKRRFHLMFYPLSNDRDAMLEQQKLEESDRQVDVELSGNGNTATAAATGGSLSQVNLGASRLVLKHLIARIDAKRDKVKASDQELRNLMIEVKKNRSKWASEDKIGQEELYEAAEKVLSRVKANSTHSQPFLTKVNKRDAPDYSTIIKHPMDLSTMTKKLKGLQYKSKQEFVDDLNLIWANCLKYNASPEHHLRRSALVMRKQTEELVPLIPDIVIRDRAEVEAEERRLHAIDGDLDGAEDSDDEPIISSRGRKAPGKSAKKGGTARKALPGGAEASGTDAKPPHLQLPPGTSSNLRQDFLRADSDTAMEGSQNGLSTPPPGTLTPAGPAGLAAGSQADPMDIDGFGASVNGLGLLGGYEVDYDDPEFKVWKQVTKRDRALVAAERNRLFKGDKINPEEPALLRTKAGMRRWTRKQRETEDTGVLGKRKRELADEPEDDPMGETLAEGMEGTEERVLPDYYDTMSAIPDLPKRLQWIEDSEGQIIQASEETLRIMPAGYFTSPQSTFTQKMHANMRMMQETRKICTKIGIVKQMQLQSQMYQNQFQKYDPKPFLDQDIEPTVISSEDPSLPPEVVRAAMQRSVGKIFYSAGFEEFQPSALDAITDIASDYFVKLATTLNTYLHQPKQPILTAVPGFVEPQLTWKPKFTKEESILHTLHTHGIDLEALHNYATDDVERQSSKLGVLHERMKSHLADLLRPALASDAGPDGVNAFNDGSDQFVGGDFAEDLDEDFFGFKELGLDKEFGLASLSVPLHLLQNRMHNAYQAQNTNAATAPTSAFPTPQPYAPVTVQSLPHEIGLIHEFFRAKLTANNDQPLIEDEDLPQKQRFPKPRLPPTGKITSPRKKPVREPGPGKGHPKKKMRMVEGQGWVKESDLPEVAGKEKTGKSPNKPKNQGAAMERTDSLDPGQDADADGDDDMMDSGLMDRGSEVIKGKGKEKAREMGNSGEGGMISPESLEAM